MNRPETLDFAAAGSSPARTAARAQWLADARADHSPIVRVPDELAPATAEDAFDTQHETLRRLKYGIGGWKVGAKSPDAPAQGAPLPDALLYASPARLHFDAHAPFALELEIAFRLGRTFEASSTPYAAQDVMSSIESMCATIEVVTSRFAAWPDVDRLWQLADLLNHGALIAGAPVPYRDDFPFAAPSLRFTYNGASVFGSQPKNPAGDPRRLLTWVVNHSTGRGIALAAGTVITTGSFIGMWSAREPGVAVGEIEGLPPVQVQFDGAAR
ncbi:2-keto-4-pentenoate hydratase [Paraburkholderia kururiensis]|uniref:2-keto-4-pentenoate hydratase n=1 Tax=Paraburkholderia kururiensis TaxID=984307 RepID=UPI0039A40A73